MGGGGRAPTRLFVCFDPGMGGGGVRVQSTGRPGGGVGVGGGRHLPEVQVV